MTALQPLQRRPDRRLGRALRVLRLCLAFLFAVSRLRSARHR